MLTSEQLQDIKQLQIRCENFDDINLKLNWDMLQNRNNKLDDFFYYEEDILIGFLALYGFGDTYELCGMVHPDHRRQHIFQDLFKQAILSLNNRTFHKLLINVPGTSTSGKGFLSSIEAAYDFTEYEMKWHEQPLTIESDQVSLRNASQKDIDYIIELDEKCFSVIHNDAVTYTKNLFKESGLGNLMIENNGQTVGKIRVQRLENQSGIYGFAIDPSFQSKGIGRTALSLTVLEEAKRTKDIFLDVAADNSTALKLYESSGFRTIYSQDYYRYPLR
ncbi:GNAT family N-acetyltransferase [Rossellomorea aquimaris]|uniref:GNAT family N-acetyltransferase n=1 Tax=Rossellomorea aquimaris TaxID=189382 RepID=UPI0007D0B931|nr:GNAT family N-acetyltransferase [Rossellomorea aquimaris]